MFKNISKYYWWCQIGGWFFWMVLNIILANYYHHTMGIPYFINQFGMAISGIVLTHLLRLTILNLKLLEHPLNKLIVRILILVAICAILFTLARGALTISLRP